MSSFELELLVWFVEPHRSAVTSFCVDISILDYCDYVGEGCYLHIAVDLVAFKYCCYSWWTTRADFDICSLGTVYENGIKQKARAGNYFALGHFSVRYEASLRSVARTHWWMINSCMPQDLPPHTIILCGSECCPPRMIIDKDGRASDVHLTALYVWPTTGDFSTLVNYLMRGPSKHSQII